MRYVLDTHALLWHLTGDARLGENARRVLDDPTSILIVPTLVLAEAKHAAIRKRVAIPFETVMQAIVASPRIVIFPMDVFTLNYLSGELDIHDSIIVATALFCKQLFHENISILTNDHLITESGLVSVIW